MRGTVQGAAQFDERAAPPRDVVIRRERRSAPDSLRRTL